MNCKKGVKNFIGSCPTSKILLLWPRFHLRWFEALWFNSQSGDLGAGPFSPDLQPAPRFISKSLLRHLSQHPPQPMTQTIISASPSTSVTSGPVRVKIRKPCSNGRMSEVQRTSWTCPESWNTELFLPEHKLLGSTAPGQTGMQSLQRLLRS